MKREGGRKKRGDGIARRARAEQEQRGVRVGEGLGASVWEKEGGKGPEQSKAARTKKKPHKEWKTDWQLLGT